MTARRRKCPYELAAAGNAWWRWAWKQPQAEHWDAGALYTVARRAQLEDDRAALVMADEDDLLERLLEGAEPDAIQSVRYALGRLAASATGSTGLSREMRALEEQLGLSPKASAALAGKKTGPTAPKTNPLDDLSKRRAARRDQASGT